MRLMLDLSVYKQNNAMISITEFTKTLAEELYLSGRYGTARAYVSAARRFVCFTEDTDFRFTGINPSLIKKYEQSLFAQGCKRNSVSLYMRMLRSICNQASARGVASIQRGVFDNVFTGTDSCNKRAVPVSVIQRICELNPSVCSPALSFARDLFLLCFYLRGIPFVDLAYLRKSDVCGDTLRYRRKKTNVLLTVMLEPCSLAILRKYTPLAQGSPYLLPILTLEGRQGYRQYQNALRSYNNHLRALSQMLGLKENLTSYVARHSWATAAYREGVPVAVISECLGHSSEKVTYNYLASFANRTLRQANRKVIALLTPRVSSPLSPPGNSRQKWQNKAFR